MIAGIAVVLVVLCILCALSACMEGSEELYEPFAKLPRYRKLMSNRTEVRRKIFHMFMCMALCFVAPIIKPTLGIFGLAYVMATVVTYYVNKSL